MRTECSINNLILQEMDELHSKIQKAIEKGEFSISGDGYLKSVTIERLRKMGYKAENGSQYNRSYWSISWR